MKKKIAYKTGILLLLNISLLNAQIKNTIDKKEYNNNSYITVNLLSSLNTLNPRWRIGYIKDINSKWKVGLDFGYGNRNLTFSDFGDKIENGYKLWEVRPEFYYIINPKRKTIKYFSAELFYIDHKDIFNNGHYFSKNEEAINYDRVNYHRHKYGFNLKYGFITYSKRRVGFNIYTGFGLRIRQNKYSKVINPNIEDIEYRDSELFGFGNYKNIEGSDFDVNFSLGFKLYYRIRPKSN